MADLGLSQARQVENLGHSPAGQTGYPTGSSANSYGAASDASQAGGNASTSESPYNETQNYKFPAATGNHYTANVADTVTVSDSLTATYHARPSVNDTVTVTDSLTEHQVGSASVSDTVSVTDSLRASEGYPTSVSDTVTVTDSLATHQADHASVSDTVTVTDATAEHQVLSVSVTDTVTVTDAATAANHYANNLSDTVTATDSLVSRYRAVATGSDTVTVTDASAEHQAGLLHVADTVTVTDFVGTGRHLIADLSDTVTVTDALRPSKGTRQGLADSITVTDAVHEGHREPVNLTETVGVSEALGVAYGVSVQLAATVVIEESFSAGSASISGNGTTLQVGFREGLRIDGIVDLENFSLVPMDGPAFPVDLIAVEPIYNIQASGSNASTFVTTIMVGTVATVAYVVEVPTADFFATSPKYIFLNSPTNPTTFLRILQVLTATTVQVDKPILQDPLNGRVLWQVTSGILGVIFETSKFTNGGNYAFSATGLTTFPGDPFEFDGTFTASSSQPQVVSAESLGDGQILVTFNEDMLVDPVLTDPTEYALAGPGFPPPYVESVATVSPTQVLLFTRNLQAGSFTLTAGTHTPHDLVGNPLDPFFNTAIFTTSAPIEARSIYTDFGPIARPPLTLEEGVGVTFVDPMTVILTGAAISPGYPGYLVTLVGTSHNDGSYKILTVVSQNTLKLDASFNLPDPNAFMATWTVVNPRDGEIADDPAHVTVTINGSPVVPEAVIGLLGQIILPSTPAHGQDIRVGYSWVVNPTVELRRLNSEEFRLNSWNRDLGYIPLVEHYRFNNVLPVTTNFTSPPPFQQGSAAGIVSTTQVYLPDGNVLPDYAGLNLVLTSGLNAGVYDIVSVPDNHHVNVTGPLHFPDPQSGHIGWTIGDTSDIQAILPQPLLRDLKYRAYERAYTALLNDPNTLTLNAAPNLIAYPPLARIVAQTFVSYEPSVLPQNDPVAPWTVVGTGTAAIVSLTLVVTSPTSGNFPGGSPIYWTQTVDQTFPHIFAATWDMQINATPVTQGVFTGVAFGYSDSEKAIVFGYLNDGGTHKLGFLVKGGGNDPSVITAWTGGLDATGNPTNAPLAYDWSILTSYRIYEDSSGNISLYLNGSVVPSLKVTEEQLPFLEELAAPFNALQGVFWGSLSSQAQSTSTWEFVRYLVLPLNPLQQAPSIYVDYVANILPESAAKPWTPVGYHGTETILSSAFLLLDSWSAVPEAEETLTGLVGGDYRAFFRIEPLIASNAEVVIDFNVALRTWTSGYSPNAMMVAVDDSDRLIQLSFITDEPAPKFSYGGDGLPTVQTPPWTALGGQTAQMYGRTLRIIDTSTIDGLVYVIDDTNPVTSDSNHFVQNAPMVAGSTMAATATVQHHASAHIVAGSLVQPDAQRNATGVSHVGVVSMVAGSSFTASAPVVNRGAHTAISAGALVEANVFVSPHTRVLSPDNGYILEARLQPLTWTADPSGFIGAMAEVYDSQRSIGFALYSIAGTPYVALQGEGTVVAQFPFNWADGNPHTYRVVYALAAPTGVVTLFIDGVLVGAPQNYTSFPVPVPPSTVGFVAFGSSVPGTSSVSTVNWFYCNAWRVETGQKFVGIWRGTTLGNLVDFWVPTKATGSNALILGNALMDTAANFLTAGVQTTDYLIVDVGPNQGQYQITGVTANTLAIDVLWPSSPSRVSYRIAKQTDWTQSHGYRIVKAPSGDEVAVFLDSNPTPIILLTYDDHILPPSIVGIPRIIAGNLPSVVWGALDPTNLSQSSWQYFRYGVTRSPTELRIVPPHQVLNQRNLIESFERHLSNLPHTLTDFWSESEGIVPNTYPDFLTNPGLTAYTLLNETTPLVPQTQTYEVQMPQPVIEYIGGLNNIANVLDSNAFLLNDATTRVGIIVPNNVLYNSLQIIERDTGVPNLIAPFDDESQPNYGTLYFQKEVCLVYDAQTLPENDPTAITPWTFYAQNPAHVSRSVFGGILTYGTDATGTQTVYTNATPLPDALSMETTVTFRLKVLQDSSGGLGDSQIRFGFSAIGLTASLALVSAPDGLRYVLVIDQLSNKVIGGVTFDFLDNSFHTYTLVRNPATGTVQVSVA